MSATYILIRSEEWARLFTIDPDAGADDRRALRAHFEYSHASGEDWGEVFYVPAERAGDITPASVRTRMTPYNEDDYADRRIEITAPGLEEPIVVAHRVDGRV